MELHVDDLKIGRDHPCFIIAEVAQAHEGSLGMAHAFIDAVSETGANAIKFQTHFAAEESTPREPWRVRFSYQDKSRYDYWKRMEFTEEQWKGLVDHAKMKNLIFLSTPFSLKAAHMLNDLKVAAWKIGSGETEHWPLLDYICQTKRPLLISSGMSTWGEIDQTYQKLKERGVDFGLFHTTTQYPTLAHNVGLNIIPEMINRYDCPIGFSSHIPVPAVMVAAKCMGAAMMEMHVAFDRRMFGPDATSSLTIDELAQLVKSIRKVEEVLAHKVDKDKIAQELSGLKNIFGKSIVANSDLKKGEVLKAEMLGIKKPGGGLPPKDLDLLLGRKLKVDITRDEPICFENLD